MVGSSHQAPVDFVNVIGSSSVIYHLRWLPVPPGANPTPSPSSQEPFLPLNSYSWRLPLTQPSLSTRTLATQSPREISFQSGWDNSYLCKRLHMPLDPHCIPALVPGRSHAGTVRNVSKWTTVAKMLLFLTTPEQPPGSPFLPCAGHVARCLWVISY